MSRSMKWHFPALLVCIATALPFKAVADTEDDGRLWLNVMAQGRLSDAWNWSLEVQPRWREEGEEFDQLLVRPAVGYNLSERSSVWLGYGHVSSHPARGDTVEENRLWQQFLHRFEPWCGYTFTSRTRLEERRLEGGDETGYRLRQMLRATHPLGPVAGASLVFWDELFINANDTDWGARSGFDQNRAFAGASYVFSQQDRLEIGYLNQYVKVSGNDRMNHVLSTSLILNF